MDQVKAADQQELEAFVAGAMDKFAELQVPEDAAKALLEDAVEKHAAALGFSRAPVAARPAKVQEFKKAAAEMARAMKNK